MWAIPAVIVAAYLAAKGEGTAWITIPSVILWTLISVLLLGGLGVLMGYLIALIATA